LHNFNQLKQNMEQIAFKFVKWEVPALEQLKESKVYKLKQKLLNGEKLSRDEKNWLTEKGHDIYGNDLIPLQRWMFDFRDFMKRYLVRQYGSWQEYRGFDKTSVRSMLFGTITEIVEIPS